MSILSLFWRLLDYPLVLVEGFLDKELASVWHFMARILFGLILLYVLVDILMRAKRLITRAPRRGSLLEGAEIDALVTTNRDMAESIASSHELQQRATALRKAREYAKLAELYADAGRPKEAARWYKKTGNLHRAAVELAKSGKSLKAAKLLMQDGDFELAARYYAENGRHNDAADAYGKAGKPVLAAAAYGRAGKVQDALRMFSEYFKLTGDAMEIQVNAAQECYGMLTDPAVSGKIGDEQRKSLAPALASRFEQGKQYDLAAQLFRDGGDLVRAGETYILGGRLEEAADCMRRAGKTAEAARIVGRFHESKGNWREAAAAFASAGDYQRAGDNFGKAGDAMRAGECFEKAKDFYKAGLAFAHAGRFEQAIHVLQKVRDGDPSFDLSRALLGRCFYEMHDYAHCAAALENHLTGQRIEGGNVEYFYMLALAFEQVGRLEESLSTLRKIHTIDVDFRDVNQRVSSISSRISMGVGTRIVGGTQAGGEGGAEIMASVENALGQRYHLEKELGRGGMGVVYLARDVQLERPVALKFLGSLVDDSEEFRQRFVREARTAARISHPNIVSIYDISASAGKAYIAMEYVEGTSLYRYVTKKGKLTAREAVNIIGQACSALGAIHGEGITHRDIKPDNILLAKGGLVKLTDFGLAKAEDSRLTRSGMVLGTPSYMAPEQAMGKEADARSDVYALGLVLYECLTGEMVFKDGNVIERQVKEVPPPPSSQVEGVPEELDRIIMKTIEKKPENRYQTMAELLQDLRGLAL